MTDTNENKTYLKPSVLVVSHAPHINGSDTVPKIMLDVIIALMPALIAGVFVFGMRALIVALTCVIKQRGGRVHMVQNT